MTMELPSMSKPLTLEAASIKTFAIAVLLGTFVLSKLTFMKLMTDPFLWKEKENILFEK